MTTDGTTIEIRRDDDDGDGRYVLLVDGSEAGELTYRHVEGRRAFLHTEVQDQYEGQGLAGKLARRALDDARSDAVQVVPLCPFVASYLERHPDDQDLIDHDLWAALR